MSSRDGGNQMNQPCHSRGGGNPVNSTRLRYYQCPYIQEIPDFTRAMFSFISLLAQRNEPKKVRPHEPALRVRSLAWKNPFAINSLHFTPLRQKLLSTDFPFAHSPGSEGVLKSDIQVHHVEWVERFQINHLKTCGKAKPTKYM